MDDIETTIRKAIPTPRHVSIQSRVTQRGTHSYEAVIQNEFLGEQRTIRGPDYVDVEFRAQAQLTKWREKEIRERTSHERGCVADKASEIAASNLAAMRGILAATLAVDDRLDWESMLDNDAFPAFTFDPPPPSPPPAPKSFWEWLIPALKRKRLDDDASRAADWEKAKAVHLAREAQAQLAYNEERARFEDDRRSRNESVQAFRARFEAFEPTAVVEYVSAVLSRSTYPECFPVSHKASLDPGSKTVVVDVQVPPQGIVPDVLEYRCRKAADPVPVRMKKKEHGELYDSAIKQTILRTIHEVFEGEYTRNTVAAVANGWITDVDPATGQERTTCVISVSASRDQFEKLNLARVDPGEAIKSLRGLVAGPLSQIAPVRPIMHLDRKDGRFVESREVLDGYDCRTNLAEIPWEDFEQLVRELFGKIFSGENAECRITQASRDGGVDAIAFDPDPIRGGKFVIQAKRYTNVVPVSAVRDLYGTLINEGAAKGLLVTTAYFGSDSREFVKDKPIKLIDGPELVYMLEQYGHRVHIDLERARAARSSSRLSSASSRRGE